MSKVLVERLQFLFDEASSYQRQEDKEKLVKVIEEIISHEKN